MTMVFSNKQHPLVRVIFFALIVFIIVFGAIKLKPSEPVEASPSDNLQLQGEDADPDSLIAPPKITPDSPIVSSPEADVSPSPEQSPEPTPHTPDLTEREAVDDEFFADAAFMGNSLMDGFRLFSGLTTCDYYAATSMTVDGAGSNVCITLDNGAAGTLVDGLLQKPYGKIYILLGINEIGYNVDTFISKYSSLIDTIAAGQPDCDIYIMGLTPVSYAKSSGSDTFNMTRVNAYNEGLHQLAADKGCYYLDLVDALAGDDGYLPADVTTDGVHFSASVYQQWLQYVKTHYV